MTKCPAAHRLVADLHPALSQRLLNVAKAQGEAKIQPHGLADHIGGEPVTLITLIMRSAARPLPLAGLLACT